MGDNTDGSSNAAQSAPQDPQLSEQTGGADRPGFLERLFGKSTDAPEDASEAPQEDDPNPAGQGGTQRMLVNLRNMQELRLEDVAIPKADIVSVPEDVTLSELVEVFRTSGFTRVPVYKDTLDDPLGFVHLKDVALSHGFGADGAFDIKPLLRPLIYAPPSMRIGVLLQKMQTERMHMALVIDEYGGVDGLLTIEDLVEQIVGEIADEHDEEEAALWAIEAPGVYLAAARAPLAEFEEAAGIDLLPDDLDEDVDTLGGLVFMLAGRVPARGEVLKDANGHEIEVIDADPRRIKRLRVRLAADAHERAAE